MKLGSDEDDEGVFAGDAGLESHIAADYGGMKRGCLPKNKVHLSNYLGCTIYADVAMNCPLCGVTVPAYIWHECQKSNSISGPCKEGDQ